MNLHEFYMRRLQKIVAGIEYRPGYFVEVGSEQLPYVQINAERVDITTGEMGIGQGGKRYIAWGTPDDAVVRTIFSAFLSYEEHEVREHFLYEGARVFGPHIAVSALAEVADRIS